MTSSTRSRPASATGVSPSVASVPGPRRGRHHVAHADRAQEARALLVDPPLEQLHRPVEGARDEAGVPVHERAAVGEAVEHREGVVPGEGQDQHGAVLPREPPRRRGRPVVALEAQGQVRRLDHHQAEGREHDGPPAAREGEAGEHREREGRDEGEARQRAHAPHEDHVLVEEAVEGGVRPQREDDRHRRGHHRDGPIPARRRGEPGDAEGERDRPGEEGVAHRGGVQQPLREPAPGPVPRRGVGRQRRRVDGDGLQRELLALERPHAEVRVHHGPQDRGREQEAGGEPPELSRLEAAAKGDGDGHRQGGGRDRAEVDRAQALQRQQEPDHERAPQRAPLPEAVQGEERERQEDGDLRVQVREARPAVRARREVGARHERRQPVSAHPAHEELRPEPREEEAAEKGDVVGENGAEGALQRRDDDGRQEQILGERQGVGKRVEVGRLEEAGRRRPGRLPDVGEDPGVEAAVGTVHRPRVREVADEGPAHDREQEDVAGDRDRDLGRGHGPGRRGAPRRLPGGRPREDAGEDGHGQGESVGQPPHPRGPRRPQRAWRNRLAAPVRPRPAETQARAGPGVVEADDERGRPFGEADRGLCPQRVALGLEHHVAVERHRGAAAAFHPQLVATRGGHAQLAGPAQADPPPGRQGAQVTADHVDGAGGGRTDRPRGAGHLGREARRAAQRHGEREGRRPPRRARARRGARGRGACLSPSGRRGWRSPARGPPGAARGRRGAAAPRWAPTATRPARGARSRRRSRAGRPARESAPGRHFTAVDWPPARQP